ncbi:MAG: hypothetical protein ACI4NW_07620 [Stenotrophomonas sp.]
MPSSLRTYAGYLFSSVLAVLLSLPIASLLGAACVLASEWIGSSVAADPGELASLLLLVGFFALIAGGLVALLFGAPLYALLAWKGLARWWSVLLLALPPALVVGWQEPQTGSLFLLFGGITALLTHLFHSRTRLGRLGTVIAASRSGRPE